MTPADLETLARQWCALMGIDPDESVSDILQWQHAAVQMRQSFAMIDLYLQYKSFQRARDANPVLVIPN